MVQAEPELQQQVSLDARALQPLVARVSADGAEQDGVVVRDPRYVGVAENLPRRQVVRCAERELGDRQGHLVRHRCRQDFQRLGDHLRADAVPGDDRELDGARHWTPL